MTEERLKEIKDSIDFQEKIANAYNCGDVVFVLNEERELYNEVVRLREIIDKTTEYCNNNIEFTPRLIDVIDMLRENNLTLEQLTGVDND